MSAYKNWTFVTENATVDGQCKSNKEAMWFHYFNPNGLITRKRKNDAIISGLVDAGVVPSGWILAYGTFASYEHDAIVRLSQLKRVGRDSCYAAIRMMEDHCKDQEAKIAEVASV